MYVVNGWGFDCEGVAGRVGFEFDGDIVDVKEFYEERPDLVKVFAEKDVIVSGQTGFHVFLRIKKADENKRLKIVYLSKTKNASEVVAEITNIETLPSYLCHVEEDVKWDEKNMAVRGWMISNPEASYEEKMDVDFPVDFRTKSGKAVNCTFKTVTRIDIVKRFHLSNESLCYGFELQWEYDPEEVYVLHMGTASNYKEEVIDVQKLFFEERESKRRYRNYFHMLKNKDEYLKEDDKKYRQKYGIGEYRKLLKKRFEPLDPDYQKYFEKNRASKSELKRQTKEKLTGPLISVVVPTYNTPIDFLHNMIDSVLSQTYSNWQLCIADGSEGNKELERILEEYHRKDARVVYTICDKNGGISGNTNAALKLVTGDYVALLDHDDMLAPEALYEVVKVINANEDADVIYTDEDKFINDLKDHYYPAFKPDFNLDYLRSCNYITHLFVVKKSIVDAIGEFDSECDGSQDFDFILRCTEQARNVYHIPKILYYWRCHPGSTALNPESKSYAYDAAKKALSNHLNRLHVAYDSVERITDTVGVYRVNYALEEKKLSIIILGTDKKKIEKTREAIKEKSDYKNIEILEACSINPPARCNKLVKDATGEYILFVQEDMDVISADGVRKMLACCERDDVGAVGGKVYYDDDTIYHVGVTMGYHGLAGRLLSGRHLIEFGLYANAILQQNVSAVLSSCMMTKKSVFEELNGFDENFTGAFYDIDYCLRARDKHYLIVVEPEADFYTHRDKYPGCDIIDETYDGYEEDVSYAKKKWSDVLSKRDPFYNPNLSLERLSYDVRYHA